MATSIWVLACALIAMALLCAWMMRNTSSLRAELEAERIELRNVRMISEAVGRSHEIQHWHSWWMRCAVEPWPQNDPQRDTQVRFAIAAQLAPTIEAFIADMHSVARDETRPHNDRLTAAAFAGEWERAQQTKALPWRVYVHDTGKPEHHPERLAMVYRDALRGWPDLLTREVLVREALGNSQPHMSEHH